MGLNNTDSKALKAFLDDDDFWNESPTPIVSNVSEETCSTSTICIHDYKLHEVKKQVRDDYKFNHVKEEELDEVINNYVELTGISKSEKRRATTSLFLKESLVLVLNSFPHKRVHEIEDVYTYRTSTTSFFGVCVSQPELQTLAHPSKLKHINNLLTFLTEKHMHNGRNYYSILPKFINDDLSKSIEVSDAALVRLKRQSEYYKKQYASGSHIEYEIKCLFDKKYLTVDCMREILTNQFSNNKVQELKSHQQSRDAATNIDKFLENYNNCLSKLSTNPAAHSTSMTNIYTALSGMAKPCRLVLDELNETHEQDISSCHPNILLSIVLGTLNVDKKIDSLFPNIADSKVMKYVTTIFQSKTNKSQKIELLQLLGGKFRHKLNAAIGTSKKELMMYINSPFHVFNNAAFCIKISDYLNTIKGGSVLVELIKYMKYNEKFKMRKLLDTIQSAIMKDFQEKCQAKGIAVNILYDAFSVPNEHRELVAQMLEEHLTEWGIPTETNINQLIAKIK